MEQRLIDLAIYRYTKAKDCLNIAIKLYNDKEYGYAQNRAYYALFDAIRSITVLDGFDSSKHSGIIAYFNQFYVKTGLFKPETSVIVKKALTLREKSDYEDFYIPNEEETDEVIMLVKLFVDDVKNFLINNKGIDFPNDEDDEI